MARIMPLTSTCLEASVKAAFEKHAQQYHARITNMKATLGHSLVAFEVYMQWYPLYEQVEKILGKRMAYLYAHAISTCSDCPLCSTFFRKIIIDSGEDPESLSLTAAQKNILDFGGSIAKCRGNINDHLYNSVAKNHTVSDMVTLIAFAGQMIATNIFNNVIETDIDDYLTPYLPRVKSMWQNE